jgi:hypothetical protein
MTCQKQGHYAGKHAGEDISLEEGFKERLLEAAKDGALTCAKTLSLAKESGKEPRQAGIYLDLLEIRILECQLGLFGCAPEKRRVKKAEIIDPLRQLIEKDIENGSVSCASLLKISALYNHGVSPLTVAGMCETLGIKIRPCQLGAF